MAKKSGGGGNADLLRGASGKATGKSGSVSPPKRLRANPHKDPEALPPGGGGLRAPSGQTPHDEGRSAYQDWI